MFDRLYRLHTEDRQNLDELADRHFEAFTIVHAIGSWRGTREPAAVIEVYGSEADVTAIRALAEDIRAANAQETVLITTLPIGLVQFVSAAAA